MERDRNKLEKMSKAAIIDMIAAPPSHEVTVELTFLPDEPENIYWYWNGGPSGCDDFNSFIKRGFPEMLKEEREWAQSLLEDEDIPY